MVVDRLALLCKTAFLVEQVLLHNLDNNGARTMLHKLVENKLNHNILSVSGVGLWQMKIDKVTGDTTILADENMKKLNSFLREFLDTAEKEVALRRYKGKKGETENEENI